MSTDLKKIKIKIKILPTLSVPTLNKAYVRKAKNVSILMISPSIVPNK